MISQIYLRRLVESVLLEGFKDDQRYLIKKYPDRANDLDNLPPKWITWLATRFGESPVRKEIHPFEDAIVTVVNFSKRDAAIGEKYKASAQFKEAVDAEFPPADRSWSSPADTMSMTIDEMELILSLSERKKQRFEVDEAEDIEGDRVGKVGPWNLWMPTTREKSCKIAGYDPITRKPKTVWCTARTAGSNLFYNYVGRPGADMTLFYVIKDNPTQVLDWLSVGFVNGEPVLEGEDGGVSVDRSNSGLTDQRLKAALGPDHDEIMSVLAEKNESLGGAHPARSKIVAAAKSLKDLNYLIKSLSKDEAADIVRMVIKEPDISPEVLAFLSSDKDTTVRRVVASNASTPAEALQALAHDLDSEIRMGLVSNPSTPAKTLQELVDNNKNDIKILRKAASNPSTPAEALQALTRIGIELRILVANNPSTPAETLQELGSDPDDLLDVHIGVAKNPSTPAETLRALGSNKNIRVLGGIAKNPSTPAETLRALANHDEASVLLNVAGNPSTPAEALQALASHDNGFVRAYVSFNPLTSAKTLQALASDKTESVRQGVAKNPSTPTETLQALASDKDPGVRKAAANSLATRQQGLNERRLRQLIRQML